MTEKVLNKLNIKDPLLDIAKELDQLHSVMIISYKEDYILM